jgi:uncharacterized protein (TIGR03435 family)
MTRTIAYLLFAAAIAPGQSTPARLSFEAVSIEPGPPGTAGAIFYRVDDSTVSTGGMSLRNFIPLAFRLPDDQVIQPDWTLDAHFDIRAKLPAGATKEQVPEMLQAMLAERFALKAHHEQRETPVYALTVARAGPKFKESSAEEKTGGGCSGGYRKVCEQVTMSSFAIMLSRFSRVNAPGAPDRPVIDATGLTGKYDFVFESGREGNGRGTGPVSDADVIGYADGLKALGLKLEPTKHTYDFLVVDHVERAPTEN